MLPQCPVAPHTLLDFKGILHGLFFINRILFGFSAGCGIDFLHLCNGKRRLLGIFAGIILLEIHQLRFSFLKFRYDESHLKAPVSHMDIADNPEARKTGNPLDAFPDDRGTQMAHVKGLCHVRSAVIHDNGLFLIGGFHAEFITGLHLFQIGAQEVIRQLQVQESRGRRFRLGKDRTVL